MGLTGAARSSDILIPKGVVIAYPIVNNVVDVDGGIDLGYCQEAELTIAETTRQVYSARDASAALAVDKVTKTEYSVPLTLMSVNADNLALMFRATKGTEQQTGGYYSNASPLTVTAPATLDRAQKLGKRGVSILKIDYDGGTAAFALGETVTGSGGSPPSGDVAWKTGTTQSGSLYLINYTGTFTDNMTLTGDGSPAGGATVLGTPAIQKDIVLLDSGNTKRYTLDIDYGLDPKSGTIFFLSTGTITTNESLEAAFNYAALTEIVIKPGTTGVTLYEVHILPFSSISENNIETIFWKCSVKTDTTMKLITVSEEEISLNVILTPLTNGPNATSEYPVFKQTIVTV